MPTYKPLGTSVKLVSCSLAESTATKPERQKHLAGSETKRTEELIFNAPQLKETHIPCFGDATRLHFLDNVPFYLVQAGEHMFKPKRPTIVDRARALLEQRDEQQQKTRGRSAGARRVSSRSQSVASERHAVDAKERQRSQSNASLSRRRSEVANETSMPQALGLVITLSKATFIRSFANRHKSCDQRQHVKWNVYFNGELACSDFQHSRYFTGRGIAKEPALDNGNVRVVSGKRVDILVERPWVILPPEQTADGSLREMKRSNAAMAGAVERWRAIGSALLQCADEEGYNSKEERGPLGQYLANLARLEMPEAVVDMQKPGGHKFGVIDVVISVGQGAKGAVSAHYLTKPERLVDMRYKKMPNSRQSKSDQAHLTVEQQSATQVPEPAAQESLIHRSLFASRSHTPASREKRKTSEPVKYRDAARTSQTTTPEIDKIPEHTSILPAFPAIPEIDFNDVIVVTPTKAEEARKSRGIRYSSPKADAVKRAPRAGDSISMPPPPIPTSRSARSGKRRYPDAISVGGDSPSKPSAMHTRPGASAGSKTVSGFMGMTKRGIFSKESIMHPYGTTLPSTDKPTAAIPQKQLVQDRSAISRVVITSRETLIVDKALTSPYSPRTKSRTWQANQTPSSPFQPLDESVIFGFKDAKDRAKAVASQLRAALPALMASAGASALQDPQAAVVPPTPVTASPPTLNPVLTPAPAALVPKPQSKKVALASRRKVKYDDPLERTRATWKTPELSEDCVISFVQEGELLTAEGKGSVLRHVRSGRAGIFTESEVVFAVRYIVAGEAGLTM